MRQYNYSESELKYIFSHIDKDSYDRVCGEDRYLLDGRLITPIIKAQRMELAKQKIAKSICC